MERLIERVLLAAMDWIANHAKSLKNRKAVPL